VPSWDSRAWDGYGGIAITSVPTQAIDKVDMTSNSIPACIFVSIQKYQFSPNFP
jgi:hypothetical protein